MRLRGRDLEFCLDPLVEPLTELLLIGHLGVDEGVFGDAAEEALGLGELGCGGG